MVFQVSGYITFNLDYWSDSGEHSLITVKSKIEKFITDPLGLHENKCFVTYEGKNFGIPLSEVFTYSPPSGTQLTLFKN